MHPNEALPKAIHPHFSAERLEHVFANDTAECVHCSA